MLIINARNKWYNDDLIVNARNQPCKDALIGNRIALNDSLIASMKSITTVMAANHFKISGKIYIGEAGYD